MTNADIEEALLCAEKHMTNSIKRIESALTSFYPHVDKSPHLNEIADIRKHRQVIRELAARFVKVAPLETDPIHTYPVDTK